MGRLLLTVLLLAPSLWLLGQDKQERVLRRLERARFEAMTRRDVDALDRMLDPTLTYTHSNGLVETKAEHLDHIRTGQIAYRALRPLEMQVRRYGKSAVVTGMVRAQGRYQGRDFDLRLRYTAMYVKRASGWRMVAWHSVRAD